MYSLLILALLASDNSIFYHAMKKTLDLLRHCGNISLRGLFLRDFTQQAPWSCLIIIDTSIHTQGGSGMTKAEIVAKVAEEIKISKAAAARALAVITDSITQTIKAGGKATLVGFGTFLAAERKARKGRNPQTGKEIKIAAKKVPKFAAGAALKAAAAGKAATVKPKAKKAPAKKAAKPKKK
jgi:DNA-binding protein HU-beta